MAETRRSSRIAAQPKKEEPPKPARKPANKRAAGEATGEDGPAKKVHLFFPRFCVFLAALRGEHVLGKWGNVFDASCMS